MPLFQKTRLHRNQWILVHQYLGLIFGLFLSILGLSGSLLMIGEASEQLMHPSLIIDQQDTPPLELDQLLGLVRSKYPDPSGRWTIEMPQAADQPLLLTHADPTESESDGAALQQIWVNPYSGVILRTATFGQTLRSWTFILHTRLQLGLLGEGLVGALGLLLPLSIVSGLYLWWPGFAGLKRAFKIRRGLGLRVFMNDLHRLIGAILAAPLMSLALTGLGLTFPNALERLLQTNGMSHDAEGPRIQSSGNQSAGRHVSVDEAILLARGPFPKAEVREIQTPGMPTDTYRVTFRQASEPSRRHPMTSVWVDQYSGQIREVRNAARLNARERLVGAFWPFHTGEMLSSIMKLIWFLSGLSLPLLFWSGLTRWRIERGLLHDQPIERTGWYKVIQIGANACHQGIHEARATLLPELTARVKGLIQRLRLLRNKS